MNKRELARQLARNTGVSRGEAADQIDRMVNDVLKQLRSGHSADLPGFGRFAVNEAGQIEFSPKPGKSKTGGRLNE
jgi:nucleoid DNA-binding protein